MEDTLKEMILRKCRKLTVPMESYDEEQEQETEDIEIEEFAGAEEELPFQDILADKRRKYDAKEEFMYLLYNDVLGYFVKSWEGTLLRKNIRRKFSEDLPKDDEENEDVEYVKSYESVKELKRNENHDSDAAETATRQSSATRLPWKLILPDEFANITFINDNTYSGRISRKMMEGEGVYRWSNGTQYKGEFQQNQMHGVGLLQLSSSSWYKGDFENGYQHGKGLFVDSDNRFMYTGEWFKGHKHGKGSYDGDWVMDKMCGFGLRIYSSGARYKGQWKNGLRHGTGTMVWTNGDVYRGEWKCGSMNGYGVYVWNSFFNETFTWPQEASYVGYWCNGMRHGEGQIKLNTIGGAKYFGHWKNDKKHGSGTIIGNNGEKFEADPLFLNDTLVSSDIANNIIPTATDSVDQNIFSARNSTSFFVGKPSKLSITPILPVLKPEQFPSLSYYLARLLDPESLEGPLIRSVPSGKCYFCDNRSCSCLTSSTIDVSIIGEKIDTNVEMDDAMKSEREYEEKWAYHCLTMHMPRIREIYANLAKLFSTSAPKCNLVMSRMCLWQFWRDCKINEKGLSLIQMNNYIARNESTIVKNPHDPFETIEIWQFLHALLEISWHLYGKLHNAETQEMNGKLAGSLHKFLENDAYPHIHNHVGSLCREYVNLLPISSVYKLNQTIGHPCSAKDFLRATCIPKDSEHFSCVRDEMAKHFPDGVNAVMTGERVSYLSRGNDIFPPAHHKMDTTKQYGSNQSDGLLIFKELGATKMLEIITLVCPGIKDPDNGLIIDMDYEISFLEFYEIILEAAKQILCIRKEAEIPRGNVEDESESLGHYIIIK